METLVGLSNVKGSLPAKSDENISLRHCQACSKEKSSEELPRCKGCEAVCYCDKVRCSAAIISRTDADLLIRTVRQRVGMRGAIRPTVRF